MLAATSRAVSHTEQLADKRALLANVHVSQVKKFRRGGAPNLRRRAYVGAFCQVPRRQNCQQPAAAAVAATSPRCRRRRSCRRHRHRQHRRHRPFGRIQPLLPLPPLPWSGLYPKKPPRAQQCANGAVYSWSILFLQHVFTCHGVRRSGERQAGRRCGSSVGSACAHGRVGRHMENRRSRECWRNEDTLEESWV